MQNCPNCGYLNRAGVVFCENCGVSLIGDPGVAASTRSLGNTPKTGNLDPNALAEGISLDQVKSAGVKGSDYFAPNSLVRFEVGEEVQALILPINQLIVFGRRDAATGSIPDVDLTPFSGYRMGVSRRHAEIRHDVVANVLELFDLGSSNGSYLNGERLVAHRGYRLRDGDQIRLGQLFIKIHFQTKP